MYIKFSEKVEECCYGLGGLGYEADDEDLEWLKTFNEREEGSSATSGTLKIDDDIFEYIMGVFELWVDKSAPMLHTDLALLPAFEDMSSVFLTTPPAAFFPAYEVPKRLPPSHQLVRMARNVWAHWKNRKEKRHGRSIIPQLNQDETNDGDPYVCFRRRDTKNQRKTRNKDTSSVDRIQRIQGEMMQAQTLVLLTVQREKQKRKQQKVEKETWDARWNLLDLKRKHPNLALSSEEEVLLFSTKSQPATKKPRTSYSERDNNKEENQPPPVQTAVVAPRGPINPIRSRQPSPVPEKVPPEQLAAVYAERVERELRRKKEMDRHWEDSADLANQPLPDPAPVKHFRCLPPPDDIISRSQSFRTPRQICFRLRRGRGGIVRLDRKFPGYASPLPRGLEEEPDYGLPDDVEEQDADDDTQALTERWRYDADQGKIGYGMGMVEDDQVIIDDYETRYIRLRRDIVTQSDLDIFKPSDSALKRVQAALDAKPDPPPVISFQRTAPQMPLHPQPVLQPVPQPLLQPQPQSDQSSPNPMGAPRQVMEAHQVQQIANQARYMQHAAAQVAAQQQQPMGPPTPINGQPPQIRRMMSNGAPNNNQPRMVQSPQVQVLPQNLVNAAAAARQGQASPQALSAMIAQAQRQIPPDQLANLVNGSGAGRQHQLPVEQLLALGNRTPASMVNTAFHASPNGTQSNLPPTSPHDGGPPAIHGLNGVTAQQIMADPGLRERIMRMKTQQQAIVAQQQMQQPQRSPNQPPTPKQPPSGSPGGAMRTGNNGSPHPQPSPAAPRQVHVG